MAGEEPAAGDAGQQIERRLGQGMARGAVEEGEVAAGLTREDVAGVGDAPLILVGGDDADGVGAAFGELVEGEAVDEASEVLIDADERLGCLVEMEHAEFAFDAMPVVGRLFEGDLLEAAPPEESAQVGGPAVEEDLADVGGRRLLVAVDAAQRADFLDQARAASQVGVEQ